MDPKPEQVAAFSREVRRRREDVLGISAEELAARVTKILGREVKRQSITQWENGQGTPRQQDKLEALDQALEAEGAILAILRASVLEQIADLQEKVRQQGQQIAEILRLLDAEDAR